jgi:hypothetical protein
MIFILNFKVTTIVPNYQGWDTLKNFFKFLNDLKKM